MYETAIVVAKIVGYLLGNSIDKKLEKDARDDTRKRRELKRKYGRNGIIESDILDNPMSRKIKRRLRGE